MFLNHVSFFFGGIAVHHLQSGPGHIFVPQYVTPFLMFEELWIFPNNSKN